MADRKEPHDPDVLTPAQVAEYLGISEKTVKRHLWSGRIPGTKVGRLWRIRRVDVERLLDPTATPRPRRPSRGK